MGVSGDPGTATLVAADDATHGAGLTVVGPGTAPPDRLGRTARAAQINTSIPVLACRGAGAAPSAHRSGRPPPAPRAWVASPARSRCFLCRPLASPPKRLGRSPAESASGYNVRQLTERYTTLTAVKGNLARGRLWVAALRRARRR